MKTLTEFDGLLKYFTENQHLFVKHRNAYDGSQHAVNIKIIKDKFDIIFPYGYCFALSNFLFYYLGGYDSNYDLKCIKQIPLSINGYDFKTSHWYVEAKDNSHIIDLSKSQFDKIINIDEYYHKGRRANLGFTWLNVGDEKLRFEKVVPTKQSQILYNAYRETFGPLDKDNFLEVVWLLKNK
tara:strand:+ start:1138 stop:1683 length:546 start_codon:yes stop_codon:yes gene_type:complete